MNLIRIGSQYGGWIIDDAEYLHGCTMISAGLGEDASFDVEFATRFKATVLLVDPTPRAILHYLEIQKELGKYGNVPYSSTGKQPIAAYDLRAIKSSQLQLLPFALWNKRGITFFRPPDNPEHVSHQIFEFQSEKRTETTGSFPVASSTISDIVSVFCKFPPTVVKLDIEGAASSVIEDMLLNGIFPNQLLVEFDELKIPNPQLHNKALQIHALLEKYGYCLSAQEQFNCSYIKKAISLG
ncbi:MAG: hypothetical protein HQM10_21460 [Candidatus Riflebacteria bacterium]|nr:hypothetical protein [Candidatus Riflebacteria bacterium]